MTAGAVSAGAGRDGGDGRCYGWTLEGWSPDLAAMQQMYTPTSTGGHFCEMVSGGRIVADWRIDVVTREWRRTERTQ